MQMSQLPIGRKARISALLTTDKPYRQRLLAMGLIPGTVFTMLRKAPLGDPIQIEVRGFALSLRKEEANILKIEELAENL